MLLFMSGVLILETDINQIQGFKKALPGVTLRVVSLAKDAIKEMTNGHWDFIFLNSCKNDGAFVSAWAAEHAEKFKGTTFFVHTLSTPTAKRMHGILYRMKLHVHCKCLPWQDIALMRHVLEHLKKTSPGSI